MDILQNTLSFQNLHGTLNRTHELIDPKKLSNNFKTACSLSKKESSSNKN